MPDDIELTHVSLFTGIAGIDLAAEEAGFQTILMVEWDAYCQKVLRKHWPDVPIIGDIKDVTKEKIMAYTNGARGPREASSKTDRCGGNGGRAKTKILSTQRDEGVNYPSPITLITGGFPCQPVSHAGKRRGKDDDRWLWPEMLRVISEVRPTWVVAENVYGLINMGLDGVLSDLEGIVYEVQTFLIPACGVDAPHRRNRIFIEAYSGCFSDNGRSGECGGQEVTGPCDRLTRPSEYAGDVADTGCQPYRYGECGRGEIFREKSSRRNLSGRWPTEPDVGRVAHGVPSRVDRLKCLGNAVVPQQIYPILKAIVDIERSKI